MLQCANCGQALLPPDRFCPNCGTPVPNATSPATDAAPYNPLPPVNTWPGEGGGMYVGGNLTPPSTPLTPTHQRLYAQ